MFVDNAEDFLLFGFDHAVRFNIIMTLVFYKYFGLKHDKNSYYTVTYSRF